MLIDKKTNENEAKVEEIEQPDDIYYLNQENEYYLEQFRMRNKFEVSNCRVINHNGNFKIRKFNLKSCTNSIFKAIKGKFWIDKLRT
jgi:predicted esterase YcpF (UPF0227 family)